MMRTQTISQTQWSPECCCPDPITKQWLTQVDRFSQTIAAVYGSIAIHLCSQQWETLADEETQMLDQSQAWARQVLIYGGGDLIAFARTVVPTRLYYQLALDKLGDQPIGPKVLFQDPSCRRSAFEYATLNAHDVYRRLMMHWVNLPLQQSLYARRSHFYVQSQQLLLTEVLLPLEQWPYGDDRQIV